jgi:hypothetical protein
MHDLGISLPLSACFKIRRNKNKQREMRETKDLENENLIFDYLLFLVISLCAWFATCRDIFLNLDLGFSWSFGRWTSPLLLVQRIPSTKNVILKRGTCQRNNKIFNVFLHTQNSWIDIPRRYSEHFKGIQTVQGIRELWTLIKKIRIVYWRWYNWWIVPEAQSFNSKSHLSKVIGECW